MATIKKSQLEEIKLQSISLLKAMGVPVLHELPVLDVRKGYFIRNSVDIANRAISLCIVASKALGMDHEEAIASVQGCEVSNCLTKRESLFIAKRSPTKKEVIHFSWSIESYWLLLWALQFVPSLDAPKFMCDPELASSFLRDSGATQFRKDASPRSPLEIIQIADLYYRYHWAVVEEPKKVDELDISPSIVIERDRALTWLLSDSDWDEVQLDT